MDLTDPVTTNRLVLSLCEMSGRQVQHTQTQITDALVIGTCRGPL